MPLSVPKNLSSDAKKVWRRTVKAADHITEADRDVLAAYCNAVVVNERLMTESDGAPLTTLSTKDTTVTNPLIRELRESSKELRQLASALRLTPASRTEAPPAPKSSLTDLASRRATRRAPEGITA